MRYCLTTLTVLVLAGCALGPRVDSVQYRQDPAGSQVGIHTLRESLRGELLEVRDTELVVLSDRGELLRVPYGSIRYAGFRKAEVEIEGWVAPTAMQRERLRLVSRYPQGISESLLRSLLQAYGQQDVRVVAQ